MRKRIVVLSMAIMMVAASAAPADAHPGRTDANGGHTCRTNCEKWGLEYGEYHYHNGGGSSSKSGGSKSSSSKSGSSTKSSSTSKKQSANKKTSSKPAAPAYQTTNLTLKVNGEQVSLEHSPIMIQNTNLVPLRELAKSLGASTTWDPDSQTIGVSKDDNKITLTIGSTTVFYNGVQETIGAAPKIIEGVTYVPAQAVAKGLKANLSYDKESEVLDITL
ncbi:copper amine oxidase N-terminal domain-containing protein [Paenibacillus oralis]|uniref:Copper amine oxidase N-terminal domain-containing protein n=1 Tax=Paenibacillus oralis TaxID=2490856 RepID=A0A3P3U9F8_9BACL|nr:copper amine oxidase N-terminal domain-containing protein [Paenibacillus oralis]RRJ66794.1 copper amine oxidase N-terminal domain-containing protein [Paenibacillus oralis]